MLKNIDTPALVVNLEQMELNIKNMVEKSNKAGIKLRPHIKTHKSPKIALKQIAAGAQGITVAKISEAEIMVQHGIKDILIAFPIIGEQKLQRLKSLAQKADIITSLDSVEVAKGISSVGKDINKLMPVYVEVDTGLRRVGREYGEESVKLIEQLLEIPFIEIRGLMTHAGHSYKSKNKEEMFEISKREGDFLLQTKQMVKEKLGFTIQEISVGSTPTSYIGGQVDGVTEMRPGTYVFNDATMVSLNVVDIEECALTIYATVVSKPSDDRIIIDAGSKTLSSDKNPHIEGYGFLKQDPRVKISWLSEEHGIIDLSEEHGIIDYSEFSNLKIGDQVEIIPNHVCPTVNLADELIGVRNDRIVEIIKVEARGKNK